MTVEDRAVRLTYACKCLNIRITSSASPSERPDYLPDPNYFPVFVKDDGIQINHPQATVRLLSRPLPISGTSRHSRFTALTCLFCALNVYRVHHVISVNIEGNETTLLPSEDWVEREILKSGTGWIDVHNDCLPAGRVAELLSSPTYAPLFSLLLPDIPSFPPSLDAANDGEDFPTPQKECEEETYLPNLKPIFLPPPFTPSNPIFIHLAEISNQRSRELRTAAEDRIRDFIKTETSAILEKERAIRCQAESLWKEFRHHLANLQSDTNRHAVRSTRSPSRLNDGGTTNGLVNSRPTTSSVTIKNFVPTAMSSSAQLASPPRPHLSALSASLATSTFHHPRVQSQATLGELSDSGLAHSPSTRSDSSTLVHSVHHGEGSNVLQFRRNVNEDINIQASYRYFVDLEEDMRRYKQSKEDVKNLEPTEAGPSRPPDATQKQDSAGRAPELAVEGDKAPVEPTLSRGRDKGKRKVTFDVKPDVVAIVKNDKAEEDAITEVQEAMFPLDDVVSEEVPETQANDQHPTLPLLEQPPQRPITIKKRTQNAVNDAFHSLRPASLPAPSHIRPIRSPPGVDSSSPSVLAGLPKAPSPTNTLPKTSTSEPPSPPMTERDVQLLKLVAADTPSHRGAWVPGSDNWKSFTSNQNTKRDEDDTEEDEEPVKSAPLTLTRGTVASDASSVHVGSLPIRIKKPEASMPLSLASYVGQDRPVNLPTNTPANNGKKSSSNAIRKAVSLEKDRARSMDPGALDSLIEEDELDDDAEIVNAKGQGEKARKQALRILKARSELPEEGMWRSLA